MNCFRRTILLCGFLLGLRFSAIAVEVNATDNEPPKLQREFRGMWIATVANIDWPSNPNLSVERQKEELLAILNLATKLKLNALMLQVRPACDAFYASKLEPWSQYLTGELGKAPKPFYDPLQFAVEEAHRRCIELHAWINPYRAGSLAAKSVQSSNHISRTHPDLVVRYGKYLWLEPGKKAVQDHVIAVLADILARYDIDGIHFDDYFYPFWQRDEAGRVIDFDDEESFMQYIGKGGRSSRDDWRRENVNALIQRCYEKIKAQKPWVKFGVSPYGIWRPGFPKSVRGGRDMFVEISCDSRRWFSNGWLDYFAPQLYWKTTTEPNYQDLLKWWADQNLKKRHLWPGLYDSAIGEWRAQEIVDEINLTRKQSGASGHIHFSAKTLLQNRSGIVNLLNQVYREPALIPASPWLNDSVPAQPTITVQRSNEGIEIRWSSAKNENTWQWVLQKRVNGGWESKVHPAEKRMEILRNSEAIPDLIAITAINRFGLASKSVLVTVFK